MKRTGIFLIIILFISTAFKSDKQAYQFFNEKGKKEKYKKVLKAALNADVVFFGEQHNNPVCHWLQYELTKDLYNEKDSMLVLGAEMFETDDQLLLDEYLSGLIKQSNFEKEAKLWTNYRTDYKPLVEFAKKNELEFIATNVPRRYAAMVNKGGFEALDSLSPEAKELLPPLPPVYDPELEGYKKMMEMMGGMGHASENLPKAQALKDATMAYNILKNLRKGELFIHYNGAYHSKNFEGIVWYLLQENPELEILTIANEEQSQIDSLKSIHEGIASFILVTPESMTKTY